MRQSFALQGNESSQFVRKQISHLLSFSYSIRDEGCKRNLGAIALCHVLPVCESKAVKALLFAVYGAVIILCYLYFCAPEAMPYLSHLSYGSAGRALMFL